MIMSVFIFPGQGAQFKGMGKSLFAQFPEKVELANDILGYDIRKRVDSDDIHQTEVTQPLIYCVSCLSWLILREHYQPEMVLGHSLGEYAALYAAQVFDFETGLEIVKKRGELMQSVKGGAMAAVIGIKAADVADIIKNNQLPLYVANYNSPDQTVVAGTQDAISGCSQFFKEAKWIPLAVSGAFHSPLMSDVSQKFKSVLDAYTFAPAKLPIILNATARCHVDCPNPWTTVLSSQLVNPVYWNQSIQYCLSLGFIDFIEVEPGKRLSGLIKNILFPVV